MAGQACNTLGGGVDFKRPSLAAKRQLAPGGVAVRKLPAVKCDRTATYSYEELADRIEQVLGERPSRSALRAAAAKERIARSTQSVPRLTAGMPRPLPAPTRTAPAAFSAEQVEAWLANHPRLVHDQALRQLSAALARGDDVETAVHQARSTGLSWRAITAALSEHDGQPRSVAGVHKRYRVSG